MVCLVKKGETKAVQTSHQTTECSNLDFTVTQAGSGGKGVFPDNGPSPRQEDLGRLQAHTVSLAPFLLLES